MYKKLLFKLREYDTIIIHRHSRPDGDAIGSQIGLREVLKATFPKKKVFCVGDESDRFSFLGTMDVVSDDMYNNALAIILDTGERSMIADDRYKKAKFTVKIDHHIFKEKYADLEIVDPSFESASGLVSDIAFVNHMHMNDIAARCLFTGMVTDSSRFRHDSVNSRTLLIASKLMKFDINMNEIYNMLYSDDLHIVRLRATYALKFQITEDNVAYIKNTKEEIANYNVDFFTISRGMVNVMSGIKGINIWVNFTEDPLGSGVVAEIRSTSKYNINPIAVKYGGGGHKCASGATLKDFQAADLMLQDLNKLSRETV